MKRRSVIALLAAAALLTGCSSGGNSVEGSAVLTGSAGSVGSVGSVGSASPASSAEHGTPGASGAGVSVPDSSAASADSGGSGGSAGSAGSAGSVSPVSSADSAASSPVMSTAAPSTAAPEHSADESPSDDYAPTDIGGVKSGDSGMALPEGEVFADAEMAAADGFADCPGPTDPLVPIDPIDPIGPIDPIEPEEPWIDPRAGLLTGGEWNDNENWDFWNSLYSSSNYGADWAGYLETWRTGMEYRAAVTVRDSSGAAVSGAKVSGMGTSAVTDNKGRAYLFWAKSEMSGGAEEFTVEYGGSTQTFTETVNGDIEPEFTLDGAAKPVPKSLDLMIMCDTTGSMGDELEYLVCELEDVVTRIRSENANVPTRISVNFYRDEGDEYVVREYPFTTDLAAAVTAISEQTADGGGDTPEAVHTALRSAVSHEWDEDSVKVMFLVLDAPPHGDVQIIDETVKHVGEAAEKGIRIVPVAASGVDKSCEYLLRSMALKTGGTYTFLTNDSGIGYDHIEPTIGSYDVEKLNDMMVRIVGEYLE